MPPPSKSAGDAIPPLPFSARQLEEARRVLHRIVTGRLATYGHIATQLGVELENLKAFCLKRAKRPRDDFLAKLSANIRRIQPFTEEDAELFLDCKRLILEISGLEYNRSWYDGWNTFFKISHQQIADICGELAGSYAFYRNFGNGRVVLKSRLDILPFDQAAGIQRFNIKRRVYGTKERISDGFVVPLHGRIVMIAKIADAEGMLCIYAEKQRHDENMTGVMLSLREGDPAFATRVVMMKLSGKNKLSDANFGLIEPNQLTFELGDYAGTISNQLDQWAVMQILKL